MSGARPEGAVTPQRTRGTAPYRPEVTSDGVRLLGLGGERTLLLPAGKAVRTLRP